MTLILEDKWVWDLWLAPEQVDGVWHLFFLQAPRSLVDPDLRHGNATVGHATSVDLIAWDYLGTTLEPGPYGAWDDRAIWTGSIVKGSDQLWYLFYTATNKSNERGLIQRVGFATSTDLHNWEKHPSYVTQADSRWYERFNLKPTDEVEINGWYEEAWRDPWIVKNPEGDGWLMLTTARAGHGEYDGRGVIGVSKSNNLIDWEVFPPISAGTDFGHFEVPQLIRLPDESWAITFCLEERNHSELRKVRGSKIWTGNGLIRAKDFSGPWVVNEEPFLPAPHYAARIIENNGKYIALAWLNYVDGKFVGAIDDPIDVTEYFIGTSKNKSPVALKYAFREDSN